MSRNKGSVQQMPPSHPIIFYGFLVLFCLSVLLFYVIFYFISFYFILFLFFFFFIIFLLYTSFICDCESCGVGPRARAGGSRSGVVLPRPVPVPRFPWPRVRARLTGEPGRSRPDLDAFPVLPVVVSEIPPCSLPSLG